MGLWTSSTPNRRRAIAVVGWTILASTGMAFSAFGRSPGESRAIRPLPDDARITNVVFVAFDTETTGFSPERDRIVELGVVRYRNGEIGQSQSWLVNPGRSIPIGARRVHGITDDMVADQPSFGDIYLEFIAFIGEAVLIAHNARFDIAFIDQEARRHGLRPPPNEVLDSLTLFRRWFPESDSHSLEGLIHRLGIQPSGFHRALADAEDIFLILNCGLETHSRLKRFGTLRRQAGGGLSF